MIIAAHPDDEALGCGGTISKWRRMGEKISLVVLSDGVGSRGQDGDRFSECRNAARVFGIGQHHVHFSDLPDNQFDTVSMLGIAKVLETAIAAERPDIVLTHYSGDLNIDHQRVSEATLIATRPTTCSVQAVYEYYVPSVTEWAFGYFRPTYFVKLSEEDILRKRRALDCYYEEMRYHPHPRSFEAIEALEKHFGSMVGVDRAEAFVARRVVE